MNKKKIAIIALLIVIIVVVICVCLYVVCQMADKANEKNLAQNIASAENSDEEVKSNVVYSTEEKDYDITPAEDENIENDGVTVENVHVKHVATQMEITTTLKNNTEEAINGYMISLELLDESNEVVGIVANNSRDVIEAGGNAEIVTYATANNSIQAVKVRIVSLEKNTIEQSIEEDFDEMLPEE